MRAMGFAAGGVLRTAAVVFLIAVGLPGTPAPAGAQDAGDGWQIPAYAAKEVNPVPLSPAALAKGKDLYAAKCRRCHGPTGTGNGPEADHADGEIGEFHQMFLAFDRI